MVSRKSVLQLVQMLASPEMFVPCGIWCYDSADCEHSWPGWAYEKSGDDCNVFEAYRIQSTSFLTSSHPNESQVLPHSELGFSGLILNFLPEGSSEKPSPGREA